MPARKPAIATTCGAIILGTSHVAHGMLTQSEQETSSTYSELLALNSIGYTGF